MANGNGNGDALKGMVDGVVSKVIVGYAWPLLTSILMGICIYYLKDNNDVSRQHTHQLEVVMGTQDRLGDRVSAEISALRSTFDLRDTNIKDDLMRYGRALDDHETRIRGVERNQRLTIPN